MPYGIVCDRRVDDWTARSGDLPTSSTTAAAALAVDRRLDPQGRKPGSLPIYPVRSRASYPSILRPVAFLIRPASGAPLTAFRQPRGGGPSRPPSQPSLPCPPLAFLGGCLLLLQGAITRTLDLACLTSPAPQIPPRAYRVASVVGGSRPALFPTPSAPVALPLFASPTLPCLSFTNLGPP